MKNIAYIFALSILISACGGQKTVVDRTKAPEPGPAPTVQIGDYETFTMPNGLTVIVVENHKLPMVSVQLKVDVDNIIEGNKAGYVNMMGELLRAGTTTKSKEEIDEAVDFIGANLSTYGNGIYAQSIKKHQDQLLALMSDVLINPVFPEDEVEKLKKRTISGIVSEKDDPNAISGKITQMLLYGQNHPYGEQATEETVANVTRQDIVNYYQNYYRPNESYLVFVGDITEDEAKTLTNKYFSNWKKGEVPSHEYPVPKPPAQTEVIVVDKPGSVQSVVTVAYPVNLKPGADDAIKASVMNSILGGAGFSGRLMQNLRETKAFTYGARSYLSSDKLVGNFQSSASVRNEVTDSAVAEFLYELNRIRSEQVTEQELTLTKNQMNGSFARSLERPQTIANFALNTEMYDLPEDYYQNYLKNLSTVSIEDISEVAKKYIQPEGAYIVIVGDKDEIAPKLKKFSKSGKITYYDVNGEKISGEGIKPAPAGVTAASIVDNYIKAIGGADKVKKVNDVTMQIGMSMQGMDISMNVMQKAPNKYFMEVSAGGQVLQTQVFNGTKGVTSGMQGRQEMTPEEVNDMKYEYQLHKEVNYNKEGYKLNLLGIEKVNAKDAYKLEVVNPAGKKSIEYYSTETGLKVRTINTEDTPMGPVTQISDMSDYKEVNGVKYPYAVKTSAGPQNLDMTVKSITVNTGIKDDVFKVQ